MKLATKPAITPNGRAFPPATPPESTTGSTGRMHGERIVITPERNANPRRTIMASLPYPPVHASVHCQARRYVVGGNFAGSITNHTPPTFSPVVSPRCLSLTQ